MIDYSRACEAEEPREGWMARPYTQVHQPKPLRCNRPPGHGGDHEHRKADASVVVAW